MKRSLKDLMSYSIQETDGSKGSVKDFLFDEEKGRIRYLEVDLGWSIFSGKKVLIPRVLLRPPKWDEKIFPINVSKKELENCPTKEEHIPLSRRDEEMINNYYKLENYWSTARIESELYPESTKSVIFPRTASENDRDIYLRSFKEITGYNIQAIDGTLGHLEDFIVDDFHWDILYMVIDTKNWHPWSKKVLIDTACLKYISYHKKEIGLNISTEIVKAAPEFDPSEPVNEAYERKLFDYYGNTVE